ncbi:MAG: ABC transporter ATP-binding protein [Desulfobacterales bacterium]
MATRVRLKNVHYHYPDTEWILNGVDLAIDAGEYTVIFGASGSGKSTLGYLFNGLIPHFFGGTLNGAVTINGIDTKNTAVNELFSHVGLVIQNADAQLFNSTVENEIVFGLESLGLSAREIDKRIENITAVLDIADLLERSPETLSGGEKRLVSIVAVLCLNPSVLLLDEPYSNLDWKGIQQVRDLLLHIHQSGKNVVVIEQRMGRFLQDCTRCLIVDQGKIRFEGDSSKAQRILVNEHLVPYYPKRLQQNRLTDNDIILVTENLSFFINGDRILKKVSLEFRRGETVAIVGQNGAGKTTLIKHFNGLLKPTEGKVILHGEDVRRKSPAELARRVGVCFQNPNDQFFKAKVKDELLVGMHTIGKKDDSGFDEVCSVLDLQGLLNRSPYRLSEGQKKRVSFASILAMKPDILVLDEPTVGQDGRFKEAIVKILGALEKKGITTIIVTHDLDFAEATTDRWIVLHDGQVVADGDPREIRYDSQLISKGILDHPVEEKKRLI